MLKTEDPSTGYTLNRWFSRRNTSLTKVHIYEIAVSSFSSILTFSFCLNKFNLPVANRNKQSCEELYLMFTKQVEKHLVLAHHL